MENNIPMRDYFAAKAMQGFAANPEFSGWTNKEMAERAYDWADAMLEVRED